MRIRVTREELARTLAVWLAAAGITHPWLIRDLSPRGRARDDEARARARRALAEHLAGKFEESRHQVTREAGQERLFGD